MFKKSALIMLLIILFVINFSIYQKEQHLKNGKIVYFPLAPVDPRSLMQGDYMALRYTLENTLQTNLRKEEQNYANGQAIITFDEKKIATYKSLYTGQALVSNEMLIYYRIRAGKLKLASNAYFFQEGDAKLYESAKYGQFRVDDKGMLLLSGLFDASLKRLGDEKH